MSEEEIEAFNWLNCMEIKSEGEATNRLILINYINKTTTRIKQQNTEIKNLKEQLKTQQNIVEGQMKLI